MKKFIFTILTITLLFSCKDDDQLTFQQQLDEDIAEIEAHLASNGLTATKDPTGIFYFIEDEGEGTDNPAVTSTVSVAYSGKFLSGDVFDSATTINPLSIALGNTIPGWQVGIPLFKKKGKGTLYIPSGYGYGVNGTFGIPGNTILIFDIELLNFN